jgi:hypothetical protein
MKSNRVNLADIKAKVDLKGSLQTPEAVHSYTEKDGRNANLLFACPNIIHKGHASFMRVNITTDVDDDNNIDFDDVKKKAWRSCRDYTYRIGN